MPPQSAKATRTLEDFVEFLRALEQAGLEAHLLASASDPVRFDGER
jgi:hypothetical protein